MNAQCFNEQMISGVDPMPATMAPPLPLAPLHLAPVGAKAVALDFAGGRFSSDAGMVLRKDMDDQLGITRALAAVLADSREARRVAFPLHELLTHRVLHMAAGSEDTTDAHTLRPDPIVTLLLDRLPETGPPLASQPTLARCANRVSRTALSRMALVLLDPCLASSDTAPQGIVLAGDATEARVHGQQEPARYDGDEGGYGFLPLHLDAGLSGRLITTILTATRFTGAPRLAVLQRVVKRLRHAWPDTLLILRGASHCASPEVRQGSDAQPARSSVTGLTSHAVWKAVAREVVEEAKRASADRGRKGTRFHATRSQAGTWSRARRVVSKGEGSEHGGNTRFVVTERAHARPQVLSQHSDWARGHRENESNDHTLSLQSDRTACQRFKAHPFRLLWHAAASGWRET